MITNPLDRRTPDAGYQGSHRAYDSVVLPDVFIPARDGVQLAADVYLPALNGRPLDASLPALVERTPYLKDSVRYARKAHWYARRGYAVVINDVRGRGRSGGEWYPFAKEAPDGYDAVEWIAVQPWCNGLVGTMGGSYAGSDQSALATLNPPHLRAQVVGQGTSNYLISSMRQGGALEQRFISYAYRMAITSQEAGADPDLERVLRAEFERVPQILGPPLRFRPGRTALQFLPLYEQWAWDILTHGSRGAYWSQRGYTIDEYWHEHADVPVLFQSGWYDTYPRGAIANFQALRRRKSSPMSLLLGHLATRRAHHRGNLRRRCRPRPRIRPPPLRRPAPALLRSPSQRHGNRPRPRAACPLLRHGRTARAPTGRSGWSALARRPLGIRRPMAAAPPPRKPPSTCKRTARLPPTCPTPPLNQLASHMTRAIRCRPPAVRSARPRKPYPPAALTSAASPAASTAIKTPSSLASRPDVLSFETAPFDEYRFEIAGPVEVVLFASSSAVDTDFTAKLLDVYPHSQATPGGFELNLADSILRARYRNGFD